MYHYLLILMSLYTIMLSFSVEHLLLDIFAQKLMGTIESGLLSKTSTVWQYLGTVVL